MRLHLFFASADRLFLTSLVAVFLANAIVGTACVIFATVGTTFATVGTTFATVGTRLATVSTTFATVGTTFATVGTTYAIVGAACATIGAACAIAGTTFFRSFRTCRVANQLGRFRICLCRLLIATGHHCQRKHQRYSQKHSRFHKSILPF